MGAPPIRRAAPESITTPLEKLKAIGTAFRDKLEHIRGLATGMPSQLRDYSAEFVQTTGSPKKHIIASAFACCAYRLAELYGPVRWRCSVSGKGGNAKVKAIVKHMNNESHEIEDDKWPRILEFMYDFSASNHSLTEVIDKRLGIDEEWKNGEVFKQLLVVESELNGKSPKKRRELVCRDLIKLCLVQSDLKVLVYPGYNDDKCRQAMVDSFFQTIERCYLERPIPGAWLFLGLVGSWPQTMSAYFHVLSGVEHKPELKTW